MTRSLLATIPVILLATTVRADEKRIALKDAPAAVQQAIAAHSQGGTLRGVSTEISGGKRVYEAELVVGGRTKDVTFDAAGAVVSTEDEIPIDQVPAPVRAALVKAAGAGTVKRVEAVTEHGATFYEAEIVTGGRTSEVTLDAAGRPLK